MKILFLNGSPHKDGFTAKLMKSIESGIDPNNMSEWLHAYDMSVKPCKGCLQCRPNKECCLPKDDGHRFWHILRSADALVIGSPTYFGNISGPLKKLIDRNVTAFETMDRSGLYRPEPLHIGKKAAIVTSCNTPSPFSASPTQGQGTLNAMESILHAGGYEIVGSILLDGVVSRDIIPAAILKEAKIISEKLQN